MPGRNNFARELVCHSCHRAFAYKASFKKHIASCQVPPSRCVFPTVIFSSMHGLLTLNPTTSDQLQIVWILLMVPCIMQFGHVKSNNQQTFLLSSIKIVPIEDSLRSLSACSPGYIGIQFKVLKHFHAVIAPLLTQLMNNVLLAGRLPDDWKVAMVIPLLKKGEPAILDNYRGR